MSRERSQTRRWISTHIIQLMLEAVIRRAGINRSATLINQSSQILGYADDLNITGRSIKAVKDNFEAIEREAKRVGLVINEEKNKIHDSDKEIKNV